MKPQIPTPRVPSGGVAVTDQQLVARIAGGDQTAFENLMRKYNGKLFRIARAILKDDSDAEDVLQDGYLDAYRHIQDFRGESQVGTWLTRIVINQALMRVRKEKRRSVIVPFRGARTDGAERGEADVVDDTTESPSSRVLRAEIRRILERRIDELPLSFRTVFVMREVEDMSVHETAECLGISPATVRTRLFRARGLLRESLARELDIAAVDVFAFAGARCDRIVATVLARVQKEPASTRVRAAIAARILRLRKPTQIQLGNRTRFLHTDTPRCGVQTCNNQRMTFRATFPAQC
jgi:RNA polymerase sigma-70 factor (ECF subfamily)